MCGYTEVEDSQDNGKCCMIEKSSKVDMHMFDFEFDSDSILLGCPRYAEHSER